MASPRRSPGTSRVRSTPPAARCRDSAIRFIGPLDPRAERILELADARGVSGPHVLLARQLRDAVAEAWGRPLTMNVSMPIAAVMLDLGFSSDTVKAVPILARTAGLLAHLAEEQQQSRRLPHGRRAAEEAIEYERQSGGRARLMLAPEVETRPWAEQLALDDARYRTQLAYLFERSAFYRGEAGRGGLRRPRRRRRARRHRPAAPHRQARAQGDVHARQSDRRASLRDVVGDRSDLFDERHHRHAQLRPADGGRSRQLGDRLGAQLCGLGHRRRPAHRLHLQRRAVRGGRGARRLRPHRPLLTFPSAPATPSV